MSYFVNLDLADATCWNFIIQGLYRCFSIICFFAGCQLFVNDWYLPLIFFETKICYKQSLPTNETLANNGTTAVVFLDCLLRLLWFGIHPWNEWSTAKKWVTIVFRKPSFDWNRLLRLPSETVFSTGSFVHYSAVVDTNTEKACSNQKFVVNRN